MTQEQINIDLFNEVKKLRDALREIANYDEQPIWSDSLSDSAYDMLRIARRVLNLEE